MPERIGGLTREEIRDTFQAFNRITSDGEIEPALSRYPRLRLPVFHAMLRQEFMRLDSSEDTSPQLKQMLWSKYYAFFDFLHVEAYSDRVMEVGRLTAKRSPVRNDYQLDQLFNKATSQSEVALTTIAYLQRADLLAALQSLLPDEAFPIIVDRYDPLRILQRLRAIEDPMFQTAFNNIYPLSTNRLVDSLPVNTSCLSCAITWWCLSCDTEFADLHRCYVDTTLDEIFSSIVEKGELNSHVCPGCGERLAVPRELLAIESPAEIDVLLASCCVCIPHPNMRVCIPPPLTVRNEDVDRVLEIRLGELEKICEPVAAKERRAGALSYRIVYTDREMRDCFNEAKQLRTLPDEQDIGHMVAETLVNDVIHKYKSGVLPLDMALEHVRKIAGTGKIGYPTLILPNDTGGDPIAEMISSAITLTIAEEKDESWALRALLATQCANAYARVGDSALAMATFLKARAYRDRAVQAGEVLARIDALILSGEGELFSEQNDYTTAISRLGQAIESYNKELRQGQTDEYSMIETRQNRLVTMNRLGLAYKSSGQFCMATQQFAEICEEGDDLAREARRVGSNVSNASNAQNCEYMARSAQYLKSGAIANRGSMFLQLIEIAQLFHHHLRSVLGEAADLPLSDLAAISEPGSDVGAFWQEAWKTCQEIAPNYNLKLGDELMRLLHAEAVAAYREALRLSEQIDGHYFAAIQATALGNLLLPDAGSLEECFEFFRKAVAHARIAISRETLADALEGSSRASELAGSWDKAAENLDEAIMFRLQSRIAAGAGYLRSPYHAQIETWAARLAALYCRISRPHSAIAALENVKSNLLTLEMERSSPKFDDVSEGDESLVQLRALEARREAIWAQTANLQESWGRMINPLRPGPQANTALNMDDLHTELDSVLNQIRVLRENLILKDPQFASWCRWSTVEPFRIQDLELDNAAVDKKHVIAGFFLSDEAFWSYRLVNGNPDIERHHLGKDGMSRLVRDVQRIRSEMASHSLSLTAARKLMGTFDTKLAQFLEPIHARTSPETNLIISPHGVLNWLPWSLLPLGDGWLVEHFKIYIVFSLGVLEKLWRRPALSGNGSVLIVADPLRGTQGELPGAAREAKAIKNLSEPLRDCKILIGRDATIDAVANSCKDREIVHFCCHGSFGGLLGSPAQLFLAPSLLEGGDSGILTPEKIIDRMQTPSTRLVNLAACEVGLVEADRGTEIDGITRAFLSVGANNVLASLWPLDDSAAGRFSQHFYDNFFQNNDAAAALRETQLACLSGRLGATMSQPSNWSGYILIGAPGR